MFDTCVNPLERLCLRDKFLKAMYDLLSSKSEQVQWLAPLCMLDTCVNTPERLCLRDKSLNVMYDLLRSKSEQVQLLASLVHK